MKMRIRVLLYILVLLWACPAAADRLPPQVGGQLPEIILKTPKDTGHADYLGVAGKASFEIPQIQARLVIIEIFSMY